MIAAIIATICVIIIIIIILVANTPLARALPPGIIRGVTLITSMFPARALPPGIVNGDSVSCDETKKTYKIEGGRKREYPTYAIYFKYGSPPLKALPCDLIYNISNGVDMS